ncbi:nucleotidyltransferase family protein [Gloeocapsa sp. PCC 73106]|uniref:nucleotidyltransferase family protein n=1 Tax=Gloeocapsa sp. PCC 73106 TaxID=102232 RepID=UPI0002ACBCBF|nr:nucleotidyltransferase family protein [Gloeocapsa sp. PCC 73106]ELS00096.1 putative nucleotidyltransferase [Gloeocapsa sp. PCC 73106]
MNVTSLPIKISLEQIEQFCQRNHIRKLSLFGSVLRNDFTSKSDVDVLVEFEDGKTPGLAIVTMTNELEAMIKRDVDLRTPHDLSCYFREQVLSEALTIYER